MTAMVEQLGQYFQYPFVRYAIVVGLLIALCSSLLGVSLVLKRFSFIGDGLSHVAFGAIAIATAMQLGEEFQIIVVLPVTVIAAVMLLRSGQNAKIKGDAALALISVATLALGYLIMNLNPNKPSNLAGDVCATLFGSTSILTLTEAEVGLCIVLSAVVIAVFFWFYHKIFAVTFDEDFAVASGIGAAKYNLILSVIIAIIIVLAINLVGSLLISALVIFPALSAMRVFKSFKSVMICAVIFSIVGTAIGILTAILAGSPVGSTIVTVDLAGFGLFSIVGAVRGRK